MGLAHSNQIFAQVLEKGHFKRESLPENSLARYNKAKDDRHTTEEKIEELGERTLAAKVRGKDIMNEVCYELENINPEVIKDRVEP